MDSIGGHWICSPSGLRCRDPFLVRSSCFFKVNVSGDGDGNGLAIFFWVMGVVGLFLVIGVYVAELSCSGSASASLAYWPARSRSEPASPGVSGFNGSNLTRGITSFGVSPIDGRRLREKPPGVAVLADAGVWYALRLPGLKKAVCAVSPPGEIADSSIGVGPGPIGVLSLSIPKNFDFCCLSPNAVISFNADVFAILRCGPLWLGGDKGGLSNSGILWL